MARMLEGAARRLVAVVAAVVALVLAVVPAWAGGAAAGPTPQTRAAFASYLARADARIQAQQRSAASFLRMGSLPAAERAQAEARLRNGEVLVENLRDRVANVPRGLVHHWTGTAFIPGGTMAAVLAVAKDYGNYPRYYQPEVMSSKVTGGKGDDLTVDLRLRKHKVTTVVLDTTSAVRYGRLDAEHQYSVSTMERVAEIAEPGSAGERELSPDQDHGYLWGMKTYWRFVDAGDGVYIESEAISLTRDIPTGLEWLIGGFVDSLPRESLQFTLFATRQAVLKAFPAASAAAKAAVRQALPNTQQHKKGE